MRVEGRQEEGKRKKEEGGRRRKEEGGRRRKEEGRRRKKEVGRRRTIQLTLADYFQIIGLPIKQSSTRRLRVLLYLFSPLHLVYEFLTKALSGLSKISELQNCAWISER
jgi:hypothetical protein